MVGYLDPISISRSITRIESSYSLRKNCMPARSTNGVIGLPVSRSYTQAKRSDDQDLVPERYGRGTQFFELQFKT